MDNLKSILFVGVLFLIPFQLSYADYDDFTVNVPNAQGSYTAVVIKKSGTGYIGPRGEHYDQFPTVYTLKSIYGLGASNLTVVANSNVEPQAQTIGIPQNDQQENTIGEKGFVITKDFITMDQCSGQARGDLVLLSRFLGGVTQVEFKKQAEGKYYIIYYGKIKDIHGNSHSVYSDVTIGDRETLISALGCFWKGEKNLETKIVDYIKKIDSTEPAALNNLDYEEPAGFDITTPDSDKLQSRMMYNSEGHYGVIFYKNILDTNGNPFTIISSTNIFSKEDLQNDINDITQELNSSLNEELKSPLTFLSQVEIKKWEDLSDAGDLMVFKKDKLIKEFMKERQGHPGSMNPEWSNFLDTGTKIADRAFKEKLLKKINEFDQAPQNQGQDNLINKQNSGFNIISEPGLPDVNLNQNQHYEYCNNYALDDLIKYNNGQYLIDHPNTLYKLEGQVLQSVDNGILFIFAINQIIVGNGQPSIPAFLYTDHKFQYGERLPAYWVEFVGYVQYDNKRYCAFRMVKTPMGSDI